MRDFCAGARARKSAVIMVMDRDRLWAKRWTGEGAVMDSAYLPCHLLDVYAAAQQIIDVTGQSQLEAVGLPSASWLDRLRRVVTVAAALHDIGKCNDQFQNMLKKGERQALRHEWVTLLVVDLWRDWLLPGVGRDGIDWEIIRWCIAGHHPKYDRSAPPELADGPMCMHLLLDHKDMQDVVQWIGATLNLGKPPDLSCRIIDLSIGGDPALDDLYRRHYEAEDQFEQFTWDQRRFVAVAKDCLVAADVAGSALPRAVNALLRSKWIASVLDQRTLPTKDAYRKIVTQRLAGASLRTFQDDAASKSGRVTFLKAGCGTGKTLAAYQWATRHCDGRRLYLGYPTTGTATEGFRDYLIDPGLAEYVKTDLTHGRKKVDFEHVLHADEDRNAEVARIESLDLWRIPVVACTVDTVLGLIQNNRRGLFGWPALAQGGFVFDEIHSYDDKLFDALLHFLKVMSGVPILLMTASLPEFRRRAIHDVLKPEPLVELPQTKDLKELEERPRYCREAAPNEATELIARIRQEIERGGKVLRVCNTVRAAMDEASHLENANLSPLIYHSRFRYIDRVQRHDVVIQAFNADGSALAVCTQVAEMSLDMSATLLVTDLAPVPSLIQRLGRLNRKPKTSDPPTRPFIVVEPLGADGKFSPLPYDADDLETARRWLDELGNQDLSQADLSGEWERSQDTEKSAPRWQSAWFDFGPATPVLELREGSPNITVVRESDLRDLRDRTHTVVEVALPMPVPPAKRGAERFDWQLRNEGQPVDFNGVPVARDRALEYHPRLGARWAK